MTDPVNPFAAPKVDTNKDLPASRDKPSFASRVSLLLGCSGVAALVLLFVIAAYERGGKSAGGRLWLYQLLIYPLLIGPIVGISVVFAAPKGKRLPGLLVNGGLLALFALAVLLVLTFRLGGGGFQ